MSEPAGARDLVEVSRRIAVAPARAWDVAGDFAGLADWLSGAERIEAEGDLRRFRIGAARFSERLLFRDPARRFLGYSLLEGPLPVEDYEATLRVQAEGEAARVRLSVAYRPAGIDPDRCRRLLARALGGSLDDLAAYLESGGPESLPL